MHSIKTLFVAGLSATMLFSACSKDSKSLNIFSIDDDRQLGLQTKQQIESDPGQFPILDSITYRSAYNYLRGIRNDILNSGQVKYRDDFAWEVYIIKNDDVQNAFCTPGGYIYVYTGLIKYLDNKSSLAGVMGHEMAHADRRHSTTQMTKEYGVQTLLDVLVGKDQNLATQIASSLVNLRFSRADETEADEYSVKYLCPTRYHADGASYFFQKIIAAGSSNPPEFLSTHPNPDNRVEDIQRKAAEGGCVSSITDDEEVSGYAAFKATL